MHLRHLYLFLLSATPAFTQSLGQDAIADNIPASRSNSLAPLTPRQIDGLVGHGLASTEDPWPVPGRNFSLHPLHFPWVPQQLAPRSLQHLTYTVLLDVRTNITQNDNIPIPVSPVPLSSPLELDPEKVPTPTNAALEFVDRHIRFEIFAYSVGGMAAQAGLDEDIRLRWDDIVPIIATFRGQMKRRNKRFGGREVWVRIEHDETWLRLGEAKITVH